MLIEVSKGIANRIRSLTLSIPGIVIFSLTAVTGKAGFNLTFITLAVIILLEYLYSFSKERAPLPYLLMIFSPLTLINYSHISDFRLRFCIFFILVYIFTVSLSELKRDDLFKDRDPMPWIIFIFPLLLFTLMSFNLYKKGVHISGDEPHYLMMTQSIVDDGDLNLRNNVEKKTYLDFIPVEIRPHMTIKNGNHLSYHMPGLSFLLIPFYFLFKLTGGAVPPQLFFRISISIINSLFFVTLFFLLRKFFPKERIFPLWFGFLLLYPSLFHSVHIFPELPASTLIAATFLFSGFREKRVFVSGALIAFSIWFHVKYYPLIFFIGAWIIFDLIKEKKYKDLLRFTIFPVISMILLLAYCKILYNTLLPTNIYPPENYFASPVLLKIKVFLSYFLDQRDGLILYTPLIFLTFLSLKYKFKKKNILLSMGVIYVFFHSITTVRGAYSPAGRPLMFIYWILLIPVAMYYFKAKRKVLFRFLSGLSIGVSLLLITYPLLVYQPVYSATKIRWSGTLRLLGSELVDLPRLFPSFITHPDSFYIQNLAWIMLLAFTVIIFYTGVKIRIKNLLKSKLCYITLFSIFFYILCFYPHLYFSGKGLYVRDGIRFFNNSANFVKLKSQDKFRMKSNSEYEIFFDKRSLKGKIVLLIDSKEKIGVTFFNGKNILSSYSDTPTGKIEIDPNILTSFKFGGKKLIHIGIDIKSGSQVKFPVLKILKKDQLII